MSRYKAVNMQWVNLFGWKGDCFVIAQDYKSSAAEGKSSADGRSISPVRAVDMTLNEYYALKKF